MLRKLKNLLPFGKALLILPLVFVLLLTACGDMADALLENGVLEDAILDYIDENIDDYNDTSSETDADIGAETEPETEVETEVETEPETESETEVETEPETEVETEPETEVETEAAPLIDEGGTYTTKDDVALYIHTYGKLPKNFITKKEAEALGWPGGSLEPYAEGKCIGGNRFGNYEGLLPVKKGRTYTECDIDTLGASKRGAKRIVFSNDGLIYYTDDHYESFELLYGEP